MKRPFLLSGIIGITLIIVGITINIISPGKSNNLPDGYISPVIAFEFATRNEQINQIFDKASPKEQDSFLQAMNNGTRLDLLFLVLYGSFLLTYSLSSASLTGNRIYYIAAILAIIAPIFDILENMQLFSIMEQIKNGETHFKLEPLHLYTWGKWGALALIFLFFVPFFHSAGKYGRFLSYFAFVPMIFGILAFVNPGLLNELFALSIIIMFVLMIVFCFIYRPRT